MTRYQHKAQTGKVVNRAFKMPQVRLSVSKVLVENTNDKEEQVKEL